MTTQTPGGLAAALAKVQAELPKLERDRTVEVQQKNGGSYSYSYVTLANLSDAILPLLAKHGLSFLAMPGAGSDGKMALRYHLMHASGEVMSGEFPLSGEGGIQMIGGRITYARRYCLAAVVGVAADEDDESRLSEGPATAQRTPPATRSRPAKAAPSPAGDTPAPAPAPAKATAQRAGRPPLPSDRATPRTVASATGDRRMVDDSQHRRMHALWNELGYGGDANRTLRIEITGRLVGNPALSTSKELTFEQAETVIAKLIEKKAAQAPTAPTAAPGRRTVRDSVIGTADPNSETPPWEPGDGALLAADGTTGGPGGGR